MMTHKSLCFVIAWMLGPGLVLSISVVGPRVLRPFEKYRVALGGGSRAYTLYVAVEGRRATGEQFSQGREVAVQPGNSRIADIEIGDPGPGQYNLIARSTSGPQFSSSAPLVYQPRSFCVFIQTDKRVYQPGDTINFRVITLNKLLLPLSGAVDVSVLDARGAPVRQWPADTLDRGLITHELLLADQPALGEWTIQVEVRGQTYSRRILVADYVLPKFQMDIQMPKQVLFTDGRFNINITARHFNGLPVRGELTISTYAVFFSELLQPVFSSPVRKVIDFNGQTDVTYDLKTDLDLAEDAARPLVVEAVLEEYNTLIRQNVTSKILLLRTPYRLKVSAPEYFKPTLPYNVQIEVVDPAGKLMEVDGEVTVDRLWDDGTPANTSTVKLDKGFATYNTIPNMINIKSTLNLIIKYKDVTERVVNVMSGSTNKQFLTVEVLSRGTAVGDTMRARISASEPMDVVHYVVVGRGDILLAKTIELSPARRSVDVSVPVSLAMAPACILLAWFPQLDSSNLLLSSAVYAPQQKLLQNKLSVAPAPASGTLYRPNGLVELRVSGESGSNVALLGEDSTAMAAGLAADNGLGNGLDLYTIEREVESFSGLKHSIFKNEEFIPEMGLDLGGKTSSDVFKNAGLVILTDAVADRTPADEEKQPLDSGTRPPLAGPYAFSRVPPPPSPRYYLTLTPQPTWMLSNVTLDFEGKGTSERWTPTANGELTVGGFSIHPTLGLDLATPQKFTTTVPLTITAELPPTLQRGETLAAIITLKSSLTVDTTLEVTFHNSDQQFEFEPLENSVESSKKIELFRRERVTVPAGGLASTAFLVTVVRAGETSVIVEASGNGLSASLFRTIDVLDGYEEDLYTWGLLDARRGIARSNVTLEPLAGTKLGPVSLLAAGDMLAGALQTLRSPPPVAGDPPHALRPLAIACILLDYLQATQQSDEAVIKDAQSHVNIGYQRLMAYRLPDGSFTADSGNDAVGDVWMTSVSARWLAACARHVGAAPAAGAGAARWLARAQGPAGGWRGAAGNPAAAAPAPLTAAALLALLQVKGSDVLYQHEISRAVDFIAQQVSPDMDAYSLSVIADALASTRHPHAVPTLEMMDKYVNNTGGTLFWSRKLSGSEWRNPWLRGDSRAAATAAHALRAMLAAGLLDRAAPVARFLLQASRPDDLDPDVLDALAQYAQKTKTSTKLRVSVNVTGSDEPRQFSIADDNALIIQPQLIRSARSAVAVTEGRGLAIVGLSAKGSTNVTAAWPRYTLDPRVDQVSTPERLQLSICIGFVQQGNETESGLTLLTVQLPSGYLADINTITELLASRLVSGARLAAGGGRVLAWVRARRAERCATLAAPRALPVARQRPGWATLIDLFDSSHRARVFFQPVSATACDLCREWPSCARACGATARQRADDNNNNSNRGRAAPDAAATASLAPALLVAAMLLTLR